MTIFHSQPSFLLRDAENEREQIPRHRAEHRMAVRALAVPVLPDSRRALLFML